MTMGENSFFHLYPGCLIRTRLPHLEKSARVVFDSFGVRFSDLEGASCCPDPVVMRGVDQETWLAPEDPTRCQVCEHCATNCPIKAIKINRRSKIVF